MTRDLDLIRKVLLAIEAKPEAATTDIDVDGYTAEQLGYHLSLLSDEGLVKLVDLSTLRKRQVQVQPTSKGHDFLDSIRRDDVWDRVRKFGPIPLDILREFASQALIEVLKKEAVAPVT